ncbi:hypothetical protein [Roseibium sp.]|uniref:hypothetical protein n=1 Tax=Roseibium sp. TaxID=1936156 RepID=UPI003D0A6F3A
MRLLSTGVAALALGAIATIPAAAACSWDKTAKADERMTVADTASVPATGTDIAIATNDLDDETLLEMRLPPVPGEKPAR